MREKHELGFGILKKNQKKIFKREKQELTGY